MCALFNGSIFLYFQVPLFLLLMHRHTFKYDSISFKYILNNHSFDRMIILTL